MNRTIRRVCIIEIIISVAICFDNSNKMTTCVPDGGTKRVSKHISELRETLFKGSEHLLIVADKQRIWQLSHT